MISGLPYHKVMNMMPMEIDIACHNAPDNCTISGPSDVVKSFTEHLQKENIFVREVKAYNIAAHSRYTEAAALILQDYMKKVSCNFFFNV